MAHLAFVAQLAARGSHNPKVAGSTPVESIFAKWWFRWDSNPRPQDGLELESSALDHSATKPLRYKIATPGRFELPRAEPTNLAGWRLNHSAKVSPHWWGGGSRLMPLPGQPWEWMGSPCLAWGIDRTPSPGWVCGGGNLVGVCDNAPNLGILLLWCLGLLSEL